MLDVSVVVPVRNAAAILDDCLRSITRAVPREIVVVDGCSTDASLAIARRYTGTIVSDEGAGVAAARLLGARVATSGLIVLIDADVVVPDGALARLVEEFTTGGYTALQAGLHSVGGPGYWGRALAAHHRSGRSKDWFGLVATVFDRQSFLEHGLDERFLSGEDIELRWRLERGGHRIGVSKATVVTHRFEDGWVFAKGQFLADGAGLARMVRKHGVRGVALLVLPLAAGLRGIVLSLMRGQPRWVPYYLSYGAFNYLAMARELLGRPRDPGGAAGGLSPFQPPPADTRAA